ncbi:Programmed cell death protein, putative [Pediculus humanus corporis]|uniref:Programmed cell death protein 5 n=1 Tax=Pediculus humanus subsp. corporis TaxID=121224 RepID=E0VLR2_PEDHC|nr:Programmed cell death protein, putative [Pediculus humanus corporis]EEB14318.1 Programmed cell death protein, putative [Pediculus humanus corporis]
MGDPELEAIKAKRLAQLKSHYGDSDGDSRNAQAAQEREERANEIRHSILSQILDQSARARLNTLMIGKPEKGKMVENMLIQMAQTGQLPGKISEGELIKILENVNRQTNKTTTVKFDRRRAAMDDFDDDL